MGQRIKRVNIQNFKAIKDIKAELDCGDWVAKSDIEEIILLEENN